MGCLEYPISDDCVVGQPMRLGLVLRRALVSLRVHNSSRAYSLYMMVLRPLVRATVPTSASSYSVAYPHSPISLVSNNSSPFLTYLPVASTSYDSHLQNV
jgi:hypothetical protein